MKPAEEQNPDFRETLYTIDKRGNRKWVYPLFVNGLFRKRRTVVAFVLILLYLAMPWISIGGEQAVFLDVAGRKFTFFGNTFWATDTKFLVLILGLLAFSLFFFTALFGRVWCGWACPETVFLEFVFRPIENFLEGPAGTRRRRDAEPWNLDKAARKGLKFLIYAFIAWWLASTALAYFVGREPLLTMLTDWPWKNPVEYFATLFLMGALLFQFGYFREQFCTVVCPYARFQSVLLDPHSIVVGYDKKRGEPRGKKAEGACVDCGLCQRVCPTGIDIRNGLQLECVNCTACIDACNSVMDKLGRERGLIRYDTDHAFTGGKRRIVRPRVLVYACIITVYLVVLGTLLGTRQTLEFQILRQSRSGAFNTLPNGRISNQLHIHFANKGNQADSVSVSLVSDGDGTDLVVPGQPIQLPPGSLVDVPMFVTVDRSTLVSGKRFVKVKIESSKGFSEEASYTILGPE